jgi:hypothetical protein
MREDNARKQRCFVARKEVRALQNGWSIVEWIACIKSGSNRFPVPRTPPLTDRPRPSAAVGPPPSAISASVNPVRLAKRLPLDNHFGESMMPLAQPLLGVEYLLTVLV